MREPVSEEAEISEVRKKPSCYSRLGMVAVNRGIYSFVVLRRAGTVGYEPLPAIKGFCWHGDCKGRCCVLFSERCKQDNYGRFLLEVTNERVGDNTEFRRHSDGLYEDSDCAVAESKSFGADGQQRDGLAARPVVAARAD